MKDDAQLGVLVRTYLTGDLDGVRALWEEVFPEDPPWNRAPVAIPAKLAIQPDLLLVAIHGNTVIGTIMAGYDGHRGWLYALAVRPEAQRSGVGTMLVRRAEAALQALGCVKVNLQVRSGNAAVVEFYQRLGFEVEQRISLGRLLDRSSDLGV